jgi:hypothetical protein
MSEADRIPGLVARGASGMGGAAGPSRTGSPLGAAVTDGGDGLDAQAAATTVSRATDRDDLAVVIWLAMV